MNTSQTHQPMRSSGDVTDAASAHMISEPSDFQHDVSGSAVDGQVLLASYPSYLDAQRVVDHLSDEKFPVETTSIVGRDLIFVEQVTGRRTWMTVLLGGLGSGAAMGLFIGLLLGLFVVAPAAWISILLWSTGFGAFFGLVFAALGYAATGGSRDFSSMGRMTAKHYDVLVERDRAAEAQQLMSKVLAN